MRKYPATRSSDSKLIWAYGEEYCWRWPEVVSVDSFLKIKCFESISRARRRYNAKGMYLPPLEVEQAREDQQHLHINQFC